MARLATPLVEVLGSTAKLFETSFSIRTVAEALAHYPRRLAERGELTDLGSLQVDDDVTVLAEVHSTAIKRNRSGTPGYRLEVNVGDGRGTLRLTFFAKQEGKLTWRANLLTPGTRGLFAGKVSVFNNVRQLTHPEYVLLDDDSDGVDFASELIPVYPATKDLRSWTIARSLELVLDTLDLDGDPVPEDIRARHGLTDLGGALRAIHRPKSWEEWGWAKKRLRFDEALSVQVALAQRRAAAAADPATARPPISDGLRAEFEQRLPFVLTEGQLEVGEVLAGELSREHPMQRLLQGEVGSGKTIVALRAMLQVVDAGGQAALLAPTEVLAVQHARTIESQLGELAQGGRLGGSEKATRVALLTGSLPAAARKAALLDAASGTAGIVVGTHALIQQHVQFADLGFVVVDEQHRFGVEQRDALREKASQPPHLLVMTATPIPRTVAMTVFGDLEISTLTELPEGRSPISTTVIPTTERPQWLERAWQRIREEVAAGHQAYVVCPRIGDGSAEPEAADFDEPTDAEELTVPNGQDGQRRAPIAVLDALAMLADGPLAGLRLAALHGRLPPEEKEATMRAFGDGRLDVLVATTVIEVGVDVPNATVMVVLDADRFGVSQLHQLRGRIGRGAAPGVCLLVSQSPPGTPARERLDAVAATTDGFALAELDVQQRHEGDVLGAAQSGRRSQLKLLSLLRDRDVITAAREEATALVAADPRLSGHPLLAAQVAHLLDDERADYLQKA
jgi:ATP-dependent DNA helicase RecG